VSSLLFAPRRDSKMSNATVRWTVACHQLDGGNTLQFAFGKLKRVPSDVPQFPSNFDRVRRELFILQINISETKLELFGINPLIE